MVRRFSQQSLFYKNTFYLSVPILFAVFLSIMNNLIKKNQSLKPYNTFGIEVTAKLFSSIDSIDTLQKVLEKNKKENRLVLGGGSNMLFTKNQDKLVLYNQIKGVEIKPINETESLVIAGGGVIWHDLVLFCIENNLAGLENLSLIPGSVGASPIQNIGAYGVEIKDTFEWLDAFHFPTGETHRFDKKDCAFGYRESVFKTKYKGEYFIEKVAYRLSKKAELNTSYGAINQYLEQQNIQSPTIKDVSNAVIAIRKSKLPDPKEIGNSGSFFKNPIVKNETVEKLKKQYPNLSYYPLDQNYSKIAAGWLIDNAGWKGKTFNNYGVHKKQALVLVNYGGATGQNIYDLSTKIIQSIKEKYNIELEREVNVF